MYVINKKKDSWQGRRATAVNVFMGAVIAACLAISPVLAGEAFAAPRGSDVVGGATAESRGINMAKSPSIEANYAYVVDSNGTVYFERDADAKTHIASITKIMTAIVAQEYAQLSDIITVSASAASVGESSAGLKAGDTLTLEEALKGLMVPSGNDAAIAIGETVGKTILAEAREAGTSLYAPDGSEIDLSSESNALPAFVAAMNMKAAELGCDNTLFANPHGLDIGQFASEMHSTARDVAVFSAYAMENAYFRSIVELPRAALDVVRGGEHVVVNVESTDWLIGTYEGACGIKTGFTNEAGACFSGACNRGGFYLYAIVLDSPSENQRFIDTRTLFDWVYNSEVDYMLLNTDEYIERDTSLGVDRIPVVAQVPLADWNGRTVPATFADAAASVDVSSIFGNVSQEISIEPIAGAVKAGDVVGKADFYQHNEPIASVDIVALEDAPAPDVFESAGIAWERFCSVFSGAPTVANTVIYNKTPLLLEKN